MSVVDVQEIGLAERQIAQIILSGLTVGDRTTAIMTKTVRRQLKLRELRQLTRELDRERQDELIAELGDNPDQNIVNVIRRTISVEWEELIDEGYNDDGTYGKSYRVDRTTLQWLSDKRTEREVWRWNVVDGKREAAELPSEMLEAIATFDEAIADALTKKKKESS